MNFRKIHVVDHSPVMKLDLEGRKGTVVAGVLISIALFLAGKSVSDFQAPPDPAPGRVKLNDVSNTQTPKKKMNQETSPDSTLDYRRLQLTENLIYKGTGRNIFRSEVVVRPTRIVFPPRPAPPNPEAEIPVPSIRLRFFGLASTPNQPGKAFFGEDDSIFVASEGEIVDRRYRVLKIDRNSVILEDLIGKSVHRLALPS